MDHLERLSAWYSSQCNGDWEHSYGVKIDTLDNPGWSIHINLSGTDLDDRPFLSISRGNSQEDEDWIHCKVEGHRFVAFGGIGNLAELIEIFLTWEANDLP